MYTSSRERVTSKGLYKEGKTANMGRKWVLTREERRGGFSKRGERGIYGERDGTSKEEGKRVRRCRRKKEEEERAEKKSFRRLSIQI